MEPAQSLKIISKAWGRQRGYCFFPYIRGNAADKKERILSYTEGPAFMWPRDRLKIIHHLESHVNDDVYWCPSLFEDKKRRMELAMDEHALWADLDEVDPRSISDYPPTTAWQTSPGRYQALWIIAGGDMQGASWAGRENQRLTYHLGADQSGWDTTQLLRLPGWKNHKPEYRGMDGSPAQGKLLWQGRRHYLPDEFGDLPEIEGGMGDLLVTDIIEDQIDHVDRHEVWGRVRLKVSSRVRELVAAREVAGDRSDALWEIERELADAGCTVVEIVAITRATVWNKFAGRSDELRRLVTEASKAVAARSEDTTQAILEEIRERLPPTNLFELVKNLKPPTWLIRDILTEGAVGFIAGQPKSFKSWAALDMALSVASGQPFLGHFAIEKPGAVLYIQEEDSGPLVKSRLGKIWPAKIGDKVVRDPETGDIMWLPATDNGELPDIDAYIGETVTISDEAWQAWLDETLENKKSVDGVGYKLLVMDPLMMMAGDVEDNRAQEMTTKIFRPLKELARKHGCSIQMVHHMKKGDPRAGTQRGGQMLLGSVANHAWAEDSLYFKLGRGGDVVCEQESKSAPVPGFRMTGIRNKRWTPSVIVNADGQEREPDGVDGPVRKARDNGKPRPGKSRANKALDALKSLGPGSHSVTMIAEAAGISRQAIYSGLNRAEGVNKTKTGYEFMG